MFSNIKHQTSNSPQGYQTAKGPLLFSPPLWVKAPNLKPQTIAKQAPNHKPFCPYGTSVV